MSKIINVVYFCIIGCEYLVLVNTLQPFLSTEIDYAASSVDLQRLVGLEFGFVNELVSFIEGVRNDNDGDEDTRVVLKYCRDFESTMLSDLQLSKRTVFELSEKGIFDVSGFGLDAAKHPLKVYKIIKRFVHSFAEMEGRNTSSRYLREIIKRHSSRRKTSFPTEKDLRTAALNILRLNQLFQLDFNDFLTGKFGRLETKCRLSLEDLIHLGKVALSSGLPSQAVDIFDTISNYEDYEDLAEESKVEVEKLLEDSINLHDSKLKNGLDVEDIQLDSGPLLFSEPLGNRSTESFRMRRRVDVRTLLQDVPQDNPHVQIIPLAYKFAELCRTEKSDENPEEDRKLKCFLSSKSHPFYLVNPLKVEVHSLSPLILQYYDVVHEKEIRELKDEVRDEMRLSRIMRSPEEIGGSVTKQRTSSNAWVADYEHSKFHPLLLKIGRVLNVTTGKFYSTENMQIAAYSPGGHYVPHTDAVFEELILEKLDPSEFLRGDRIITFMIYLSEVEVGGATAFPMIGKVIRPQKGSAVMWFNLHGDGSIRRDTVHGGCSVVYGVKWIANKWIRSLDQMFGLKCPTKKGDSLSLDL